MRVEYGCQTKNGPFYFILRSGSSEDWERLLLELGMEHVLGDPRFDDFGRQATSIGRYAPAVKPLWEEAFKNRTREEVIALIHSIGGVSGRAASAPCVLAPPPCAGTGALL